MATANCSITGFKYYNGGWLPSSGWSTASSNVSGYGGTSSSTGTTYTAVYQFTIPSVSGTVSSGTISFALPWIDGGYSSTFSVNYHITKTAPSTNASVQGTTVASGSISDTGSNSQQWKTKSFTTGAFNATTGTYYLYLKQLVDKAGNVSTIAESAYQGTVTVTEGENAGTYHKYGPYIFDNTEPTITVNPTTTTNEASADGKAVKKQSITITVSNHVLTTFW